MPVPSSMVGSTTDAFTHQVDERWTMAYSASIGDFEDCYLDTSRPGGVVAHPLFAVCPEWPVIVSARDSAGHFGISPNEVSRSVHATHDVTVHRLVRPGDELTTTMAVAGLEQRRPGTFSTMRLETIDADGLPVATTEQGAIYLGVPLQGGDRPPETAPDPLAGLAPSSGAIRADLPVQIGAGAAHTYTECARIWNPVHTDPVVAHAAGLPDIILHGTATLAYGVSQVVRTECAGDPSLVRRIRGRFRAMVLMPSTITVRIGERVTIDNGQEVVRFEVLTQTGAPAIDDGLIVLGAP